MIEDVKQFYEDVTHCPLPDRPTQLSPTRKMERYHHLNEEIHEWLSSESLDAQLDALIDLQYVLLGTALEHGFGDIFAEAWRRVHQANMQKIGAHTDRSNYDAVKPEGWRAPEFGDLLCR